MKLETFTLREVTNFSCNLSRTVVGWYCSSNSARTRPESPAICGGGHAGIVQRFVIGLGSDSCADNLMFRGDEPSARTKVTISLKSIPRCTGNDGKSLISFERTEETRVDVIVSSGHDEHNAPRGSSIDHLVQGGNSEAS